MVITLQYEYKANHCAELLKLMQSFMSIQGQKPGGPHARRVAAKRSYPIPRSGAAAESARLRQHRKSQEELPCVRGQGRRQEELSRVGGQGWPPGGVTPRPRSGQRPREPGCDSTGTSKRRYPASEVRAGNKRSYPASKVRGGRQEELPHNQGAVAVQAQEGLEELFHVEGQEGRQ